MKKHLLWLAVLVGSAAVSIHAQSVYEWSFVADGGIVDGSGTLTADGYQVTQMTGTYLGEPLDGLGGDLGGADNLLMNLVGDFDQLDGAGITFEYGLDDAQENIYGTGGGADTEFVNGDYGVFSAIVVPVAVPEPSVNSDLVAAALLIGWRTWRGLRTFPG